MDMQILRPFWVEKLQRAWRRVPIAWLSGVRRVGKTTLAHSLDGALYLSCDLPSTADRVADPERFLRSVEAPVLILDEIHQLPDPSRLLKIAADAFPHIRVLATGSSTLAATQKFRDSLTGRKQTVHLQPVLMPSGSGICSAVCSAAVCRQPCLPRSGTWNSMPSGSTRSLHATFRSYFEWKSDRPFCAWLSCYCARAAGFATSLRLPAPAN